MPSAASNTGRRDRGGRGVITCALASVVVVGVASPPAAAFVAGAAGVAGEPSNSLRAVSLLPGATPVARRDSNSNVLASNR